MSIELLRNYDLDGVTEDCVRWECSCGIERIATFHRVKLRQTSACPECGCFRSFSTAIVAKFQNEIEGKN